jgi:hypothetical protein
LITLHDIGEPRDLFSSGEGPMSTPLDGGSGTGAPGEQAIRSIT